MVLTDKKALSYMKTADSFELRVDIEDYPEDERHGRSDLQFLMDEVGWVLSRFEEDGYSLHDALEEGRELLALTMNGKDILGYWRDMYDSPLSDLKERQIKQEVKEARETVNEYKRLLALYCKLFSQGYKSEWRG